MGINFEKMADLLERCSVKQGARVLDIGCSNIHSLDAARLADFVRRYNDVYEPASLQKWADLVTAGGAMDPELGGANGAWLGDVLARAGFQYKSFDIFDGYNTERFDLNLQSLAPHHHGAYDLVLNFGTTEHLLGQLNAFKVIHEAAAVGGWIIHDLPMTGHMDHGYFCYNPMLFMHLAAANGYEISSVKFSGGDCGESIDANLLNRYQSYDFVHTKSDEGPWLKAAVPTASILVIFRKINDAPFRIGLETSTTAGAVHSDIAATYAPGPHAPTNASTVRTRGTGLVIAARHMARAGRSHLRDLWRRARRNDGRGVWSLWGKQAHLDLLLEKYYIHLRAHPDQPFPQKEAMRSLQRQLSSRRGGPAPLPYVSQAALRDFPLLAYLEEASDALSPPLAFDGVEAMINPDILEFKALLAAYGQYYRLSTVDAFPPRLEAALLLQTAKHDHQSKRLHVRTGQVMGRITPSMEIQKAA